MGRWWNRLLLLGIIGLTVLSIITIWPTEPHRYISDVVPWPEGRGIRLYLPTVDDTQFQIEEVNPRAMTLGLDLRGGTRLVLEPEEGVEVEDLDEALEGARDVIERRVNEFGVAESEVTRLGDEQLDIQLPGIDPEDAAEKIGRTALLQFCQPVIEESSGRVAIARTGTVQYEEQTCEPARDEQGNIVVEGGQSEFVEWPPADTDGQPAYTTDQIVWEPASAEINGQELALDGRFLSRTVVVPNSNTVQAAVDPFQFLFETKGDGSEILEEVTTRLAERGYPLASFLDGEPIRGEDGEILAPQVSGAIPDGIGEITGLTADDERDLSRLLNTGAFPVPLRIVQQQEVDASLGETAVRNSVVAGIVALSLIMLFMVLYYRLPGLMASLALVTYTSVCLAIFKVGLPELGPIVLTLAGVAAFILSVGMAVDANILVFERFKEEVRAGRNFRVALEDGFNRAWSSIRDSNVATIITCLILYWFGDRFGEEAIKSFAITLAIGVAVSMFSAIIVTRTYMRFVVGWRWAARRPWLFAPDLGPPAPAQGVPAVAGGSGSEPNVRKGGR
jgi:preprotein translocase subunit SecD